MRGKLKKESAAFIYSVQEFLTCSAEVTKEPPVLRRFVETKNWKAALRAQDEMIKMATKVRIHMIRNIHGLANFYYT